MELEVHKKFAVRVPQKQLQLLFRNALYRYGKRWKKEDNSLSLAFVDEHEMQAINKTWRGQNKATDVLSFDYGEVVICVPETKVLARKARVSQSRAIAILFTHGFLHILGFDHEVKKDRQKMKAAEIALLEGSGLIAITYGNKKNE